MVIVLKWKHMANRENIITPREEMGERLSTKKHNDGDNQQNATPLDDAEKSTLNNEKLDVQPMLNALRIIEGTNRLHS